MNRKDFFKKLGLGAIVAFTAPKLLSEDLNCSEISNSSDKMGYCEGLVSHLSKDYPCQEFPITEELYVEWSNDFLNSWERAQREADYQLAKRINDEIWEINL